MVVSWMPGPGVAVDYRSRCVVGDVSGCCRGQRVTEGSWTRDQRGVMDAKSGCCRGRRVKVIMSPKHVVFKKISRDKSVGVYMTKRDFVDHCDFVDPVDGVVLIDPLQVKGKKVYVMLACTFRYGRQDMDVLGMAFRRDVYLMTRQVYPPLQDRHTHSHTQDKILRKLGNNAYPFFFEFPDNLPCSVTLQPAPSDVGKKCAVEFEVKAFCTEGQSDITKESSVSLSIRKIQYAPEPGAPPPSVQTTFEFLLSDKPLHLKLSLEKETYYHGEPIRACVEITNSSSRNIKDISISIEQVTNIILYSNDKYIKSVAKEETSDCVPVGTVFRKEYTLLLGPHPDRRGLALDGKLKHQDTNLASSSIVKEEVLKEVQGILVSYKAVVRMIASGEVSVEVPFRLMNPKPEAAELVFEEFKRDFLKGVIGEDDGSPAEG
ncbi:unnamed protein product [Merluccius merluccius]